jgi:hypothetical protein
VTAEAENEERIMSKFPKLDAAALCGQISVENASFSSAAIQHFARNIEALADSISAIWYSVGEANRHIFGSTLSVLGQRITTLAALAAARGPHDLLEAHRAFARHAIETYAASIGVLSAVLLAGVKAAREPLLERLR